MASVFFLLIISTLLLTTSSTFIADLVTSTCSQTPFVNVCLSSLRSDPRSATSDVKGLATIALDQTIANANHTKSHVLNLIKSHNPPNQTEYEYKCLKACLVEYLEGLDNLQASSVALVHDNLYTVNSRVAAAMTDAQTCEDGYLDEDLEENPSPLTVRNQLFSELASNFLAIVRLLK